MSKRYVFARVSFQLLCGVFEQNGCHHLECSSLCSNESYAGRGEPYSRMDYGEFSPYAEDGTLITPLNTDEFAAPKGSGDAFVQGYNFRLCTTQNKRCAVRVTRLAVSTALRH